MHDQPDPTTVRVGQTPMIRQQFGIQPQLAFIHPGALSFVVQPVFLSREERAAQALMRPQQLSSVDGHYYDFGTCMYRLIFLEDPNCCSTSSWCGSEA